MIQKTFESNGVQYGAEYTYAFLPNYEPVHTYQYFKLVMANNKGVPDWVGVSVEEYELAKRGFERDAPRG